MKFKFSIFYIALIAFLANPNARAISLENISLYRPPSSFAQYHAPSTTKLLAIIPLRENSKTKKPKVSFASIESPKASKPTEPNHSPYFVEKDQHKDAPKDDLLHKKEKPAVSSPPITVVSTELEEKPAAPPTLHSREPQVSLTSETDHAPSAPALLEGSAVEDLPEVIDSSNLLELPYLPDTDTPALNAGVLPLSIHPETGEVMALLGLENRWWDRSGYVYTDFGGKIDPGETKKEAAVREGNEETAFVFKDYINHSSVVELVTRIDSSNYAFYVVPVPYLPKESIQRQANIERRKPGNHVEKSDYVWVKLSDLVARIYDNSQHLNCEGKGRHRPFLFDSFIKTLQEADTNGYFSILAAGDLD